MGYRNVFKPVKPIKRLNRLESFITFDTETYVTEDADGLFRFPFRLGVAHYYRLASDGRYTLRHRLFFDDPDEFVSFILDKAIGGKVIPVIAHNVGFDLRVLDLPRRLLERGWDVSLPHLNQRTFIMHAAHGKSKVVFLDTANWGVTSVAALGEEMGRPKMKIDFDTATDAELTDYCDNDVKIISEFVIDYAAFIHTHRLGGFRYTIGAQALAAYRHRFMSQPWYPHSFPPALALERDAYYGGRTECFFIGDAPEADYYNLDINSFYPYAMKTNKIPYRLVKYASSVAESTFSQMLREGYVIARVLIRTDENRYPYRISRRLVFPVGEFVTPLHDPELRIALQRGHVKHVYEASMYHADYIFSEYVDYLYEQRRIFIEAGMRSWGYVAKLLLNSLYGKFGQRGYEREVVGEADPEAVWRLVCADRVTDERYTETCWAGVVYRERRQGESCYSMPAISGAVTAYGRSLLAEYIFGLPAGCIYYCDTDSLIVDERGYDALRGHIHPSELGKLKLDSVSRDMTIHAPKDYRFGDQTKIKGVPNDAIQTKTGRWSYMQYEGFIGYLNGGGQGGVVARKIEKARRSSYTKGCVNADGTVEPLLITGPHRDDR